MWRTPPRERQAALLVGLYALATLTAVGVWLLKRWDAHHNSWAEFFFGTINVPVAHSLISVSALTLLTAALAARKRFGLIVVAVIQAVGAYAAIVGDIVGATSDHTPAWAAHTGASRAADIASAVFGAAALIWLWRLRPAFPARLRRGSWFWAGGVAATGLVLSVATTWYLVYLVVPGPPELHGRLVGAALGRSLGDADLLNHSSLAVVPAWIPQVTSVLVSFTLVAAVWVFLRSARHETAWTPQREVEIRRLIATAPVPDSLDYFATRRDKSSIFSPRGGAAIAYRVIGGVSLAAGDPVGDPHQWPEAISAWKEEARRYGWVPAVLGAGERGARAYAGAGLRPVSIGDEAILHPDTFALDSPEMTTVRHAVRRARRRGLVVTVRPQGDIAPDELAELSAAAERWRGNEPDRGFSMALNREGDPADAQVMVVTTRDESGALQAVLTLVPWGRAGRSLDLMRRSPQAPNGTVELAVVELLQRAGELGIRELSLNFCMFRSVYADAARLGAGALTRFNYSVLGRLDALWQLERLYVSNQKYGPEWRPRYLCHDGTVGLPLVAVAAGVAEGFLPHLFARHQPLGVLSPDQLAAVRALDDPATPPRPRRNDQERVRLAHVEELRALGREPWPVADCAPLRCADDRTVIGRVRRVRDLGGVVFADVATESRPADLCQVVLEVSSPGADARAFARLVDTGDLVRFRGGPGVSRSGEPSLLVGSWELLAKSLHPVVGPSRASAPSRPAGGSWDAAALDRVTLLRHRSAIVRAVREALHADGFTEVETPMLHAVHGGASARPFRTRSFAYGTDLSLRIAPELYLKRLLVAGMGPVFEIGRNFRNEGVDASHNPEFTALEVYLPGGDYTSMRPLAERLVRAAAVAVHGRAVIPLPDDTGAVSLTEIDADFGVTPVLTALSAALGIDITLDMDFDQLLALAREHDVRPGNGARSGDLVEGLYGRVVEPATSLPRFFTDFPEDTSPLTRPHRSAPGLVERWDLVANGMELGTAYSELTDPLDQRDRLVRQSMRAAAGDLEAMEVDEAFLRDLELGMPPTGGLGIGIDRLVMLVTGVPIRSVLAFPFARATARRH